jgi:hypothetical protein
MNKILTKVVALRGLLIGLSLLVLFHLLVLLGIIPFEIVWGGKITDVSQMRKLETVSIIVSLFMLAATAVWANASKTGATKKITTIILWIMFLFFCFNTITNLLSGNLFEQLFFAPLTLLLALFTFRVAKNTA